MTEALAFIKRYALLIAGKRLTAASAALSYFLTMTFFPLLILLYSMLGSSYPSAVRLLSIGRRFLAEETARTIEEFLLYVARNNSRAMTTAAAAILLSSASAAVRSLQATIGELQGCRRFKGLRNILFSVLFSLLFVAVMYVSALVMLTGENALEWLNRLIPGLNAARLWRLIRFPLLAVIDYGILYGVYEFSVPEQSPYPTRIGALSAAAGMISVSALFSGFIGASSRYPLVYGSLSSVILLMLWLHVCCFTVYAGAALNVLLRDLAEEDGRSA